VCNSKAQHHCCPCVKSSRPSSLDTRAKTITREVPKTDLTTGEKIPTHDSPRDQEDWVHEDIKEEDEERNVVGCLVFGVVVVVVMVVNSHDDVGMAPSFLQNWPVDGDVTMLLLRCSVVISDNSFHALATRQQRRPSRHLPSSSL
jgi:hypothetical protein